MITNKKGFSMIEILVGIFIFTLGLTSIYALIISTMNMNEYSKNSIIATSLSKEAIELVRNVRDNNYNNLYRWNKLPGSDLSQMFLTGVYYKVENNFSPSIVENVTLSKIDSFHEGQDKLTNMETYRLCLDTQKRYTYNCMTGNEKTYFYRYVKFDDVIYNSGGVNVVLNDSLKLTSKVIWYKKGYHEIELKTILTDYLRQ